jgi:ribosome-binding protein aMBF1 (putative translation factor)
VILIALLHAPSIDWDKRKGDSIVVEKPPPDVGRESSARQTDIQVGKRISRRMSELALAHSDIAARMNVTVDNIQLWVAGQLRPTPGQIADLAEILDVPVPYFFEP